MYIYTRLVKQPLTHAILAAIFIVVMLATFSFANAAEIASSYQSNQTISKGSIVSFDTSKENSVVLANTDNATQFAGVAVDPQDTLLSVDPDSGAVHIVTNGSATVLVSDVNGDIKAGDQVVISPFNGVGMKAAPGGRVVGVAQNDFNGDSGQATTAQVTEKSGVSKQVKVGTVQLNLSVGTVIAQDDDASLNYLQKVTKSITGRTVATYRIVLSIIIALVIIVALIALTYASVYGSIISVGRNPYAKQSILRALSGVLFLAFVMVGFGGAIIYWLLH